MASNHIAIDKMSLTLSSKSSSSPEKVSRTHFTPTPCKKSAPQFSETGTASKSVPNLQDIEREESSSQQRGSSPDDMPSASGSLSGTAYTYTTSAISGAYSYMTSFYASPQQTAETEDANNGNVNYNNVEFQSQSINHQNGHYFTGSVDNEYASIADLDKYPIEKNQSNLHDTLCVIGRDGLNNDWTALVNEPLSSTVKLRSLSYLRDAQKEYGRKGEAPLFRLAHSQAFKTDSIEDHIALNSCSWFQQNIDRDDMSCFTIIIHLQIRSIRTSFISYHVLEGDQLCGFNRNGTPIVRGDKSVTKLLDIVLNCADRNVLNNKWKLIPRIVSGPYPVKKVVENRPVLLGNKVPLTYYRGRNYFEIDAKVDDTMVASSIVKLCHRFAKRIVVDMAWTIQGDDASQLPERLLCGVTIHNMNFDKCRDEKWEQQNCPKLIYTKNNRKKKHPQEEEEHKENK